MYFDTHAHYDFTHFDEDRQQLLETTLPQAGISNIINISYSIETSQKSIEYAQKYDYVYAAIGIHPLDCGDMTDADLQLLENMAKNPKVVAIGEVGLDYYHDTAPDKEWQKKCFAQQLDLVKQIGLPVAIHCRDAHDDVFEMLAASRIGETNGGVMHCYSDTPDRAAKYVEMGFYIGIGGPVTYRKSDELRSAVAAVPKERLLIETDCPFLPPEPKRGTRNDSRNLYYIAQKIGAILGLSHEEVAQITCENAKRLFCIS